MLREADPAHKQHSMSRGALRDYSMKHQVEMRWDLNAEANRDLIFELRIDDVTVLLDWEAVQRLGRWI